MRKIKPDWLQFNFPVLSQGEVHSFLSEADLMKPRSLNMLFHCMEATGQRVFTARYIPDFSWYM
jgi:hypothetical protein